VKKIGLVILLAGCEVQAADTIAPSRPSNVSLVSKSQREIRLKWTASSDNVAVKGYKIYSNGSQVADSTDSLESVYNLQPATTYSFTVKAFDAAGNYSSASTAFSATTLASTTTTPTPTEPTTPLPTPLPPPTEGEYGWTEFKKSVDTRVVYVSSSTGSDSNNGLSETSPVKTPAKAATLVRDNFPDWILFKRGDVFTDPVVSKNGRSPTEKFLVGAYGTGLRPRFNVEPGERPANGCGRYKAFVSLHFSSYKRDPDRAGFSASSLPNHNEDGVKCVGVEIKHLHWEDMLVEFFTLPFYYNGMGGNNITFFRNVIRNSWADAEGVRDRKSQSMYLTKLTDVRLEENMFYMNGWNPKVTLANRSYLNHNLYTNDVKNMKVRKNVSHMSSSLAFKINAAAGGSTNLLVEDNVLVRAANGISISSNQKEN
jgi:hypothetical protein